MSGYGNVRFRTGLFKLGLAREFWWLMDCTLKGQKSSKFIIYLPQTCFPIRAVRDNRYILLQSLWSHNNCRCTSSHWWVFRPRLYHPLDSLGARCGSKRYRSTAAILLSSLTSRIHRLAAKLLQDGALFFRFSCNFRWGFHMVWKRFGSWNLVCD